MEGLSATLMYVGIGSVLTIGVAILIAAVLLLRTARRYVDLAETRLELLREGQALLLEVARQQGHVSEESREREPERRERIPEVVGHALGQRMGEESVGGRTPEESDRYAREAPGIRGQVSSAEDEEQRRERTPKASVTGGAATPPKDGAPLLGVKVAHPDDDVTLRDWNGSATKFFQKCYDRYLEHYEGYVRLAERIHRMQDEASPGALGRREREDKLRRAYDAIERTTQRLDILEEHYPELATDGDRISSRISTARLHAGLAERFGRSR
jgi:hypothetical protein